MEDAGASAAGGGGGTRWSPRADAGAAIRSGAFGFNSVLTAIALAGVLFVLDTASAAYALFAAVSAAVVFAAASAALQPLGMPALTLPFVIVVWLFVLAGPRFPRLRAVPGT